MILSRITPLILTYNEDVNLERVLDKLKWASQIVVVDSMSDDGTLPMLRNYPAVRVYPHEFKNHTDQWNYGLSKVPTEWVLSLDADYVLSDSLIDEIAKLNPDKITNYCVNFKYCVHGKSLRASLYPPRIVLFKREKAVFKEDGHTQRVHVEGAAGVLAGVLYHDDRKPFKRWLSAQKRYSKIEAYKLHDARFSCLNTPDKLRKLIFIAPFAVLVYCLIFKGLILNGHRGLLYTFQRVIAETLLSFSLVRLKFQNMMGIKV